MEEFKISFPNKNENISLIRLSSSFVAMRMGFTVDDIEDIKLCATECCNLQADKIDTINCNMIISDDIMKMVFDLKSSNKIELNEKDKISEMIIQSLMDEYEFNESEIIIIKNRK